MSLLDRHIAFVEALRAAGLPVSLAEALDAVHAVERLGIGDREVVRAAYAATLVKRHGHRPGFDQLFDLYFPARVGQGVSTADSLDAAVEESGERVGDAAAETWGDGPAEMARFQDDLGAAMAAADPAGLARLAREGVQRFGLIRGRGPGEQRWSAYNVMNRVSPQEVVDRTLAGLAAGSDGGTARRVLRARAREFEELVEAEVRRLAAEVRGPAHVAQHTVRPTIDQLDFTSAKRTDLEQMRREIQPLARRLASRLSKEHHSQRSRGPLDFRRTVRASMSSGGIPLETRHRPRRPGRSDLVVLCDVSGSVANFAGFTLMLVFTLREQFNRVRAFTFVDDIHEVTDRFTPGADPATVMSDLAASAAHASLWGRTHYGRAFTRFAEDFPDALTPRTNLLILGDARSNHSDLALPVLRELASSARRSWWLNPEHPRHWDTGDSAAGEYAEIVSMVECRNLTQLGEFVHDLA